MATDEESKGDACPLNPAARAAWLKLEAGKKKSSPTDMMNNSKAACREDGCAVVTTRASAEPSFWTSLTSWLAPWQEYSGRKSSRDDFDDTPRPATVSKSVYSTATAATAPSLAQVREISSIPRAEPERTSPATDTKTAKVPANCESESGLSAEGNWIYPSERMFFDAMRRKGYSSEAKDMKTIVPIHNAVNERTWKEIKEWEKPWLSQECYGPKLHSFKGLSSSLTPKARLNTWLGYMAPFDRHDWIIDRCGKKVEYVIDYYAGKDEGKMDQKLNFFLDVRPKLNSWEGWKMRAAKILGIV